MTINRKLKKVLAAGLLLTTLGSAVVPEVTYAATTISYGTTGWVQAGSAWKYIESSGTGVVESWKEIDGKRYYFDASGNMMTNTIIQDHGEYYFVNEDGVMVKNEWKELSNSSNGKGWYYFGPTGQAYRNANTRLTINDFVTINGVKYAFDSKGKMLTGWRKASSPDSTAPWYEADFYFSEKGALAEGWKKIKVKPYNKAGSTGKSSTTGQEYWFYFDKGQKVTDSSRYIDDRMYAFDTTDGHMLVDWLAINNDGTAVIFNPDAADAVSKAVQSGSGNSNNGNSSVYDTSGQASSDGSPYVPENRPTITEKTVVSQQDLVTKKISRSS